MKNLSFLEKTKIKYEHLNVTGPLNFSFWGNSVEELFNQSFDLGNIRSKIIPVSDHEEAIIDVICIVGGVNNQQLKQLVTLKSELTYRAIIVLIKREIDSEILGDHWYQELKKHLQIDLEINKNKFSIEHMIEDIRLKRYELTE